MELTKTDEPLKKLFFYRPKWMVWLFRLTVSLNLVVPCLVDGDHSYPAIVLAGCILAFWLDIGKLTWLSLVIMGLMLVINNNRLFWPPMIE